MTHLLCLGFRALVVCEHCRHELPISGISPSVRCPFCQRWIELGDSYWKSFDLSELERALDFVEVLGSQTRYLLRVKSEAHQLFYGKLTPRCQRCQAALPLSMEEGLISCSCQHKSKLQKADPFVQNIIPMARWLIIEASEAEPSSQEAILFSCLSCGQTLETNGAERIVSCHSCHRKSFLPDTLWRHLHPSIAAELFFVICEFPYLPRFFVEGKSPDPHKRGSLAKQKLPEELFAQLAEDSSAEVLLSLLKNPHLPAHLIPRLLERAEHETLSAAAQHADTPLPTLEAIARGASSTSLQEIARRNPTYKPTALQEIQDIPAREGHTEAELQRLAQEALREAQEQESTKTRETAPPGRFQGPPPNADPYRTAPQKLEEEASPKPSERRPESSPLSNTWRDKLLRWMRYK